MLSYKQLMAFRIPEAEHVISRRELQLYALAVGAGNDLPDADALPFVYEKGFRPLATYYTILSWLDPRWLSTVGVDIRGLVHVGESLEIHAHPPHQGTAIVTTRICDVVDKGPDRGAILSAEFTISEKSSGQVLAVSRSDLFCRKDGGIEGAPSVPPVTRKPIPSRTADGTLTVATRPEQAALYRLCGDLNPIHIDPEVAHSAGFDRPLMHGLATYGMAYRALVSGRLGGKIDAASGLGVRFSGPVFPGETMQLAYWEEPDEIQFRITVDTNRPVLDGHLALRRHVQSTSTCQEQAAK